MKATPIYRLDWLSTTLVVLLVFTAAVRLDTTGWTPDLGYVESLAVMGVVLGLALALSHFKMGTSRWLAVFYSLFLLPMQLSKTITGEKTGLGQLASLGGRLVVSIQLLFNHKPIEDYIFFVVLMGILFWFVGMYSGYKLVKGRATLHVLLPSTIPILVIQYYDGYIPERIWGLAVYFFLALFLAGRINLLNSRDRWEKQRVVAGNDPEYDLNKNIFVTAMVIVMTVWLLPAPSVALPAAARAWHNFNQPFESVRKRFSDILAALNSSRIDNSAADLYGDSMGLGRAAGAGEAELFSVVAPQNSLPRLYWRMRVYDAYENGTWQATNTQNTPFEPGENNLKISEGPAVPLATFTFNWQSGQSAMLATPSLPVWASRKGSIQTFLDTGGNLDILSWAVSPGVRNGDQYQVRAALLSPTQKELRQSGNKYPDWIKAHYLQVPPGLYVDYKQLAEKITASSPDNFDRAEAITDYLRENITYADSVPPTPEGEETLEWFLFSWKKGFCNYYASAEVMLLRSLGIPARLVVGFAEGQTNGPGVYNIRGQDAHAWPEVYFPGTGWVQFEPTVNQAALVRPSGETSNTNNPDRPGSDQTGNSHDQQRPDQLENVTLGGGNNEGTFLGIRRSVLFWISLALLFMLTLGALGWRLEQRQPLAQRMPRAVRAFYNYYHFKNPLWLERWLRWSEASPAEHAFHSVNQSLRWLGKPQPAHATPIERALLLKTLLPEAAGEIDILSTTLEKNLFTPVPSNTSGAYRASWDLRFLTVRKIIRARLFGG